MAGERAPLDPLPSEDILSLHDVQVFMSLLSVDLDPPPDYFNSIDGTSLGLFGTCIKCNTDIILRWLRMSIKRIGVHLPLSNRIFQKNGPNVTIKGNIQGRFEVEGLPRAVEEGIKEQELELDTLLKEGPEAASDRSAKCRSNLITNTAFMGTSTLKWPHEGFKDEKEQFDTAERDLSRARLATENDRCNRLLQENRQQSELLNLQRERRWNPWWHCRCRRRRIGNWLEGQDENWTSAVDEDFKVQFFQNSQQPIGISPPESSLYFALLREWLQECDKSHRCKNTSQFWPTRVIFVGDSDSSGLQLWETRSKQRELSNGDGYVALSYCWGGPSPEDKERFCTTRENYDRRLKGFTKNDLPKTFKDAVHVTRALGKQYLWIDALCIIQTIQGAEDNDWKDEAGRMEQVFNSAHCTIAASSAMNWDVGFLERKSAPHYRKIQVGLGRWTYACDTKDNFQRDVDDSVLNKRAWVLQERMLSRRTIHFAENHTYFECGRGVRCENFIKLESPYRLWLLLDHEFPERLRISGYDRTIDFIQHLFEKYAQSGLTNESDRDVAISSLVKRMEHVLATRCRYGIFEQFLSRLLLWRVPDEADENTADIIAKRQHLPSWSWMTRSKIQFLTFEHLRVPPPAALQFDSEQRDALSVQMRVFQNCSTYEKGSQHIIQDGAEDVGKLWFDTTTDTHFDGCVVIGSDNSYTDAERTYHILLVKKILPDNRYERVGVGDIKARCVSKEYWERRVF